MPRKKQVQTEYEKVSARLLRRYGITLDDYDAQLARQNGGCAICSRPPGTKRLHVDHDHKFWYKKVKTIKIRPKVWEATLPQYPSIAWTGTTKSDAIAGARQFLKKRSVRGLLCFLQLGVAPLERQPRTNA